ncbi:MAG: TrmH family RNA methyltransferase [Candidatus Carsonella ruddii]
MFNNIIIKNFRKSLKKIRNLIKLKFFFILSNLYIKKKFFFKCNSFFLFFHLTIKKNFLNKNYVVLYFLKNNGNINSCIRTCYVYNVISVVNFNIYIYINNIYNNIIYIKNFFFFTLFFKKKIFLALTIKSSIFLKKIKKIKKFILIIGNEKKSLIKKINSKIDIFLKIKTYRKKSLNVNVINGILLNYLK